MKTTTRKPHVTPSTIDAYNYDFNFISDLINHASDNLTSSSSASSSGSDFDDVGDGEEDYVQLTPTNYEYIKILEELRPVWASVNSWFSVVTVAVNLLHLLVLLHKKTRSSAVFIFMIGIAVADIPNFAFSIHDDATEFKFSPEPIRDTSGEYWCGEGDTWSIVNVPRQIVSSGYGMTRRISIWLALLLALVRTMSVMFPMSGRIQKLTTPPSTVIFILMTFLVCFVWETRFLAWNGRICKFKEILPKECLDRTRKKLLERTILVLPWKMFLEYNFVELVFETVLKWTPAIVYPILTVLLFVELRAIKARRRTLSKEERRGEHTTLLILVMTFSFSVTEFVSGLALFIELNTYEGIAWFRWDDRYLFNSGTLVLVKTLILYLSITLRCFNSFFHPIVCLFISSQYRETVEGVVLQNPIGRTVLKMFQSRKGSGRSSKISSSSIVSPTSIT